MRHGQPIHRMGSDLGHSDAAPWAPEQSSLGDRRGRPSHQAWPPGHCRVPAMTPSLWRPAGPFRDLHLQGAAVRLRWNGRTGQAGLPRAWKLIPPALMRAYRVLGRPAQDLPATARTQGLDVPCGRKGGSGSVAMQPVERWVEAQLLPQDQSGCHRGLREARCCPWNPESHLNLLEQP